MHSARSLVRGIAGQWRPEMPPDTDSSRDLDQCAQAWQAMRLTYDQVSRMLVRELALTCGLSISEFDVLLYLHTHEGSDSRIQDVGAAMLLSQPALSRLIARLVDRGLLARSSAEDDGRAVVIHLTEAGRTLTMEAINVHSETIQRTVLGRLTDVERDALVTALVRIGE